MNYSPINSLWDLSQTPSQFSQLADDDFLALLQKQFSSTNASANANANGHSIDPQSVQSQRESPPSDDSSPSPPSNADAASRRQSLHVRSNDAEDAPLKRKASSDDMEAGPSLKNQHTGDDPKKSLPARRKSTGNSLQDESRLLKRKEQNRAAQRAFRERKEKHVKDLEDKVAALEAKNEVTEAENTNLRDLLSRLQQENLALKQARFTFSVPKGSPMSAPTPSSNVQPSAFSFFSTPSAFPPVSVPAQPSSKAPVFGTDIDWNALTSFDPSMLVLDEPSDVPMQTDPTTSPFGQYALPQSYKTIANNPLLMSFIDESPSTTSTTTSPASTFDPFTFNFPSPTTPWSSPAQPTPLPQSNAHTDFLHPNHSLDELFGGGNFLASQGPLDINVLMDSTSMSPISHGANGGKPSPASQKIMSSSALNSSSSSPNTSSSSQSPFWTSLSQPGESPPSASESMPNSSNPSAATCMPITISRADVARHIAAEGPSPFTDIPNPLIRKTSGDVVACQGSNFPRTQESPDNIEVLKAWRCITQNPHFKDADLNELCAEFSKKARCDGTKMVLEPQGVQQLFEKFKRQQQQIPSLDHPSS